MSDHLLDIQNVTKIFGSGLLSKDEVIAVENVSLMLPEGDARIITIAGESGSGKSTLGLMTLGFLEPDNGAIHYKGNDIYHMRGNSYASFRREVQAVFQNPFEAFNPFYHVDHTFDLVIKKFKLASDRNEIREMVEAALNVVRLDPENTLGKYPHQLSGGQLQRIMLARAFLLKPRIIVADEPVSMIDASLRAIVLDIMVELKEQFGISQLYITHDLSTALQISDELLIMYQGNVVERGDIEAVIENPQHPYTQLLIQSIPTPDPTEKWEKPLGLEIEDLEDTSLANGCKFYDRCPHRMDRCLTAFPQYYEANMNQLVACYLYDESKSVEVAAK